ncbi:MAG: COP23 domain-containing protein [Cyanobacteria bacterium J06642_3]
MEPRYLSSSLTTAVLTFGMSLIGGIPTAASEAVFSCESDQGRLTTVATNKDLIQQPVFHWSRTQEPTVANPQQLCNSVSQKLNNYIAQGNSLSAVTFRAQSQMDLPAVCVAESDKPCSLLLFTLAPNPKPDQFANAILTEILDGDLQTSPVKSQDRGVQSIAYEVDFWQLLGFR